MLDDGIAEPVLTGGDHTPQLERQAGFPRALFDAFPGTGRGGLLGRRRGTGRWRDAGLTEQVPALHAGHIDGSAAAHRSGDIYWIYDNGIGR